MPKAKRARKAQIVSDALAILVHIAGDEGFIAALAADGGEGKQFAAYGSSDRSVEAAAPVSRSVLAHCFRQGWLAPDESRVRFRITQAGRRALEVERLRKDRAAVAATTARAAGTTTGENALAWLRNRRDKEGRPLITQVQFDAGEKLARDFWQGQLSPRVTANWSVGAREGRQRRAAPGAGVEVRDAVIAARGRFQGALEAVGPELAGILVNVCCEDMGLEAAGRLAGWPQRAAKVVLDIALTRLARHYGMIAPDRPTGVAVRHWGDADYRPTLDAWREP